MRTREQRLPNSVQRPKVYEEVLIDSAGAPITFSVWRGENETPCVLRLPGTMTRPLVYEEFLDGIARTGFNVVGGHLRGHGKSPRTSRLFSFEDLVHPAARPARAARGLPT
jgi:alpha-beta hydrolase superfamily lysophospholipase